MDKKQAIKNLDGVITHIERARLQLDDHHIVQLVAVSKYSTSNEIAILYEAGQRAFGENKIQDLKQKQEDLSHLPIAWHFIGTLQKNKINNLIDLNPVLFHSLDSLNLAIQLDKRLGVKNKTMNCLLQINSAKEDTKSGVMPEVALEVYKQIEKECKNINLKGIMCIGANTKDIKSITNSFKTTKQIFNQLSNATICSMGMSGDFELAILEGSNMVRIGSKLFS